MSTLRTDASAAFAAGAVAGDRPMSAERQRWLAAIYEANFAVVVKRCRSILQSAEDAADAAHEVFLVALDSLEPDADEKRARSWLLTVAQNHCLDLLRRRKRFGRLLTTLGPDEDSHVDLEATVAERDFVDAVLRQLSLRERLALWQSAVEHRSLAEIASGLQLSYAAAAQMLHRARLRAVKFAASVAAVIAMLRPRRPIVSPSLDSLLGAHTLVALAALPLIAISLQSSAAPASAPARHPTPASITGSAAPASEGIGAMLRPLTGPLDRASSAGHGGANPAGGLPTVAAPGTSSLTQAVQSLTDRGSAGLGALPVNPTTLVPLPSLSPLPTTVPVPTRPPGVP